MREGLAHESRKVGYKDRKRVEKQGRNTHKKKLQLVAMDTAKSS